MKNEIFMPKPLCQICHDKPIRKFISWDGERGRVGMGFCKKCYKANKEEFLNRPNAESSSE